MLLARLPGRDMGGGGLSEVEGSVGFRHPERGAQSVVKPDPPLLTNFWEPLLP